MKPIFILILTLAGTTAASGQGLSIEWNIADAACLGTIGAKADCRVSDHWAAAAGVMYNGWSFRADDDPEAFQNRRRTFYAGPEYRPVPYSGGVWATARIQLEQYNRGGLFGKPETEEGNAIGMVFGGG